MSPKNLNIQWLLLASLLICGGIALNRGIDLLWAVVLFVAVAWGVAYLMPRLQLRGLTVTRVLPAEATLGQPARLIYELHCPHWYGGCGVELHDCLGDTRRLIPVAYFGRVRGQEKLRLDWEPQVRGIRHFGDVVVESRFPWGLAVARRTLTMPAQSVTIYPDAVSLDRLPVQAGGANAAEMLLSTRRGGHDEFFGLKSYRPGDDVRAVHWRASARSGELLLREFEHQQDRQFWIMLDQSRARHVGAGRASTMEYMCRIAHSVMLRAHAEGLPTGICFWQAGELQCLPPSTEFGAYLRGREALATVGKEELPPLADWLRAGQDKLPMGGSWLLFNLAGLEARGALLSIAHDKMANPLFVEFDIDSFATPAEGNQPPRLRESAAGYPLSQVPCGADLSRLFASL